MTALYVALVLWTLLNAGVTVFAVRMLNRAAEVQRIVEEMRTNLLAMQAFSVVPSGHGGSVAAHRDGTYFYVGGGQPTVVGQKWNTADPVWPPSETKP